MSLSNVSIKSLSKDIYRQNSINFTVTALMIMAVWFIISYFSAIIETLTTLTVFYIVLFVLCFLFFAPLLMGFLRFSWRLLLGVADTPLSVFYYFSSKNLYIKVLKLIFSIFLRTATSFLIFYLPFLVFKAITSTWFYAFLKIPVPMWTFNLSNLGVFLKFLAVTATFFSVIKYYLSLMLFVADENMDTEEAMHLSSVISKRTTIDFIFLLLSFTGWILLSFLSIPLIFTIPYMTLAYLIHSQSAVDAFNKEISRTSYDDIPTFIAGA